MMFERNDLAFTKFAITKTESTIRETQWATMTRSIERTTTMLSVAFGPRYIPKRKNERPMIETTIAVTIAFFVFSILFVWGKEVGNESDV